MTTNVLLPFSPEFHMFHLTRAPAALLGAQPPVQAHAGVSATVIALSVCGSLVGAFLIFLAVFLLHADGKRLWERWGCRCRRAPATVAAAGVALQGPPGQDGAAVAGEQAPGVPAEAGSGGGAEKGTKPAAKEGAWGADRESELFMPD